MLERIRNILSKYTSADVNEINELSVLTTDVGLSSFDMISVISAFEDEFDIEISDRDIRMLVTVGDVMKYIKERNSR